MTDARGAGTETGSPPHSWWDATGRIVLAVHLGLPAILLAILGVVRLLRGNGRLDVVWLPLLVALLEVVAAGRALRGRMGMMGFFLALSVASGLAGFLADLAGFSAIWLAPSDAYLVPVTAAAGLVWLALRRLEQRGTAPRLAPVATLVLLAAFAAGIPDLARRAGLGAELLVAGNPRANRVDAGQRMPAGAFALPDGSPVPLDDAGVLYVVNFWATWCGPCMVELPELLEAVTQVRDERVRLLAVNTEDLPVDRLRRFLRGRDLGELPVVLDPGGMRSRVGLESLPLTLVVRDGVILERHDGYRAGILGEEHLRRLLEDGS